MSKLDGDLRKSRLIAWGLFSVVITAALIAWGSGLNWQASALSVYTVFPLLGLLAWSIMWTHYVYGTLVLTKVCTKRDASYKRITGYLVLGLILLHPGLLALAQWNSLNQLPPGSYNAYVGTPLKAAVILGEVAFFTFLSFEIFDRLRHKPFIKKNWIWISLAQIAAMVLIFIHSLKLGSSLQAGWFKYYWLGLGLAIIPCFIVVGWTDFKNSKQE